MLGVGRGEREHGHNQTTENVRNRKQARSQEECGKDILIALSETRVCPVAHACMPVTAQFGLSILVLTTITRETEVLGHVLRNCFFHAVSCVHMA